MYIVNVINCSQLLKTINFSSNVSFIYCAKGLCAKSIKLGTKNIPIYSFCELFKEEYDLPNQKYVFHFNEQTYTHLLIKEKIEELEILNTIKEIDCKKNNDQHDPKNDEKKIKVNGDAVNKKALNNDEFERLNDENPQDTHEEIINDINDGEWN